MRVSSHRRRIGTGVTVLALLITALTACSTRVSIGAIDEAELQLPTQPLEDAAPITPGEPIDASADGNPDATASDAATDATTDAGWSPCAGKVCGQSCKICPPFDINCFETQELKQCSKSGTCISSPASCL